ANTILFSPFRTMQVTPHKLIVMLGLNEGSFPRTERRTAFDLLAIQPRYGDRSLRLEDRLAFLEAIMCARARLIITFTGKNISNNNPIPPSPAVIELLQYLNDSEPAEENHIKPINQKLHGFNPAYYSKTEPQLFSYSHSNYLAATALMTSHSNGCESEPVHGHSAPDPKELSDLREFFENPAKFFFTEILNIRIPNPEWDTIEDTELFDLYGLHEYKFTQNLLDKILDDPNSEPDREFFNILQEQSAIPLGTHGIALANRIYKDMQQYFATAGIIELDKSLLDTLLEQRSLPNTNLRVQCEHGTVTGLLPIFTRDQQDFLLFFRYSKIKPKDRLNARLAHLLASAAHGKPLSTVLVGSAEERDFLKPIPPEEARHKLNQIIGLYLKGHREILPFAPATSFYFANKYTPETNQAEFDQIAGTAWRQGLFPENRDAYLFEAWKQDGPTSNPDFSDIAIKFWKDFPELPTQPEEKDNV
ncbi:MAG: hypothetical protein GX811_08660, partial [Lentisphaerae bacterium]|nr:hypothetical protein [Lentisphaerota bacterium]